MKKTRSFHRNRRLMSSSEEEELVGKGSDNERLKNLETPHTTINWRRQNSDMEMSEDKQEMYKEPSKSVQTIPNIMHKDLTFEERCD